ncbi:putative camk rad53 protein kinase [Diplodia seriata]|uniref:Putative camk rad53 protein kinase n=1 Tax=Diplodia seriata TaxID=420778 RepID=A0A0G2G134_9PEZI|nr:putative camk rad53 protein kinase [Diplodia seriata]
MPSPPIPPEAQTKALIESEINRLTEFQTRLQRRSHFTKNFKPLDKLGRGGEGSVQSMSYSGGGVVAVKTLKQAYNPSNESVPQAHNEVRMLALLMNVGEGPGRDTICRPATDEMWYPCTPDLASQAILLEFCALGSLWDYMKEQCCVDARGWTRPAGASGSWEVPHEGLLRHVYTQLLEGLAFLHYGYGTTAFGGSCDKGPLGRKPVVHRDIKPANVLVCPAKPGDHEALVTVKISDFGGAAEVNGHRSHKLDKGLYFFTRGYIAPEFLEDGVSRSTMDQANDVFAMGTTMHYCVVGHGPWKKDREDRNKRVLHPKNMKKLVHRGGEVLSDGFVKSVAGAVTYRQHRKDALTLLETLKRGNAAHRRDFVRWLVDVEGPRIEKEREEQRQREQREAEAREKEELETIRQALPTMCMVPDCKNAPLPHTHGCLDPARCHMATIAHSHMLLSIYGTWADPRSHLACELHMARHPNRDMQRAINHILLKAKDLKLLRDSWLDEVV